MTTKRPHLLDPLLLLAVVVAILGSTAVPLEASPTQSTEVYRPPLWAEVLDLFRPPGEPWLAGNRGLEYDTEPGAVVYAIGSGLVVFAGPVANQLYVTVLHGDGIRSSYSYLSSVSVAVGQRIRAGQSLGLTSEVPFHLGARVGDTYIDPASLFGSPVGTASVYLVPTRRGPAAEGGGVERRRPGHQELGAANGSVAHSLVAAGVDIVRAVTLAAAG